MSTLPLNLVNASKAELIQFLDSFDHVFSDCDGVIWNAKHGPLKGSPEFFQLMETLGKTVHFVSNNSLKSKQMYETQFNNCNIQGGYEKLTIPSVAIAEYLKSINFTKDAYCVTCTETVNVLKSNGIKCKIGPELIPDSYNSFNEYLMDDKDVGAVVFDSDFKVNLPKISKALTYLKRPEVLYINGATDKYAPFGPGQKILAMGMFSDIVTEESNRQPLQLGKPGKLFGELAMRRAGLTDPTRVLFIGDMIDQDIGLGKACGFKTLLVLTTVNEDIMRSHKLQPDYYATCLGDIVELLDNL